MHEQLLILRRPLALMIDEQYDTHTMKPSQSIVCKICESTTICNVDDSIFEGKQSSF